MAHRHGWPKPHAILHHPSLKRVGLDSNLQSAVSVAFSRGSVRAATALAFPSTPPLQ